MSAVCFFVPAAEGGAAGGSEAEGSGGEEAAPADAAQHALQLFWQNVMEDIKKVTSEDFKTQALPLARIKKIMKLDEEVKMISAEAPVMFAKAAEIFIHELTLRAWSHTEDNKRRTLQRNDIAMAISKSDQFDFLIDIVPRHEVKPNKPRDDDKRTTAHTEQVFIQQPTAGTSVPGGVPAQFIIQQQQPTHHQHIVQQSSGAGSSASAGGGGVAVQQPVTLLQQIVTSNGEVQQIPIQLSQAQLNMIRLQVQNNPTQPIVIQTQQQSPQIIQVTSQAQHQPQQQVFLAQLAPDDS